MTCDHVRPRLTAFVDGELDQDTQSALRGHLRTCAACQAAALDEAAVRDELAALPSPAPPASLWTAIERGMAQAQAPRDAAPQRAQAAPRPPATGPRPAATADARPTPPPRKRPPHRRISASAHRRQRAAPVARCGPTSTVGYRRPRPAPVADADADVAATLAAVPAQVDARYQQVVDELLGELAADRQAWPAPRQAAFAEQLTALQQAVAGAVDGRPREKAWRAVVAAVQAALVAPPQIAGLP